MIGCRGRERAQRQATVQSRPAVQQPVLPPPVQPPMHQAIQQRDDAGSVGEDLIPFFKRSIGGEDDRFALVAPVDHFIE